MNYFSADRIHNGQHWLTEGSVIGVEDNGRIEALHTPGTIDEARVQHLEGILCPGFINTHCHLELSHMKGVIAEGNGLVPFLQSVMLGRNNFTEEQKREALEAALEATRRNGVVAVGDIANSTDTLQYRPDAGFHIHTFIESIGFTDTKAADRFAYAAGVYEQYKAQQEGPCLLRQSIVPHAPYSVSESMFRLIDSFEPHSLLSIHNEETEAENELYHSKSGTMFDLYRTLNIDAGFFQPSGKTSLQSYLPLLGTNHPLILVHNTFMNASDLDHLSTSGREVYLCLCPQANWYIERQLPPVSLFRQSSLPVCLGTDSLASNHELSIWSEIALLQQHFPDIALEELLCWATYNGAKALQMDHMLGTIEPGKQPGIVHIDREEVIRRIV